MLMQDSDIHIWKIGLNFPINEKALDSVLSPDETKRLSQFKRAECKLQYLKSRFALRCILAKYLNRHPANLEFSTDEHGKPWLSGNEQKINFSLSHSAELALVAVSKANIGVDIEKIRAISQMDKFSKRFFSPRECDKLFSCAKSLRLPKFFEIWTTKEAYLKAKGIGLRTSLKEADIGLQGDFYATRLELCETHAGTVVSSHQFKSISYFDFALDKKSESYEALALLASEQSD